MIRKTAAALAFATCFAVPMLAGNAPATDAAPAAQSMPANPDQSHATQPTPAQSNRMMGPNQNATTAEDLTGKAIYTAKGHKIGTVSAMSMGSGGEQTASVMMERYLGMGGQTILIPVSSLKPRAEGGLTTSLTSAELKALPKAEAPKTQ